MSSRTRSRKAVSIGSNQSAKSGPASSASGCRASRLVVGLVMAWSPARRANAGIDRVGQPGDYATPNSNQPRDATDGAQPTAQLSDRAGSLAAPTASDPLPSWADGLTKR